MDFLDIQEYVLDGTFDETDRALVKDAVNARYSMVFDGQEWTFTQASANVTVTANSRVVSSLPTDLGIVLGLARATGDPLENVPEYRDFAARYVGTDNQTAGTPEAFCAWAGNVYVGPTSNETSASYLLTYEKQVTALSGNTDTTVLPDGYDLMLVFGAKADVARLKFITLSDSPEQGWNEMYGALQRKYLVASRGARTQMPAYRPC